MSTHVNRRRVRDRLARLDDEYGVEYCEDERVEVEPERFPAAAARATRPSRRATSPVQSPRSGSRTDTEWCDWLCERR